MGSGEEWSTDSEAWRFVLLRSGSAYWLDAIKPRELSPGELLVVSPKTKGAIRASQLGEALLHWFAFDPSSIFGFFTATERQWLESGARHTIGDLCCFPSTHPITAGMAALLDSYPREQGLIERGKAMVVALSVLSQDMPARSTVLRHPSGAKARFQQIISRMPEWELIQHSSEELARLCGCTPRHFNRMFRVRFGAPPRIKQAELRLRKACQLLENSGEAVAEIAATCGYQSLAHFKSLFKRHFGMTPLNWRKQHRSTLGEPLTSA